MYKKMYVQIYVYAEKRCMGSYHERPGKLLLGVLIGLDIFYDHF